MNRLLIIIFSFLPLASLCQFHVAVEANPDNHGEVNTAWVNNYVVTVTNDNWATKQLVYSRAYYEGFDDNGIRSYQCYYQKNTFRTKQQAIVFAKSFTSYDYFKFYENDEYKSYLIVKAKYDEQNKKLCFGCKNKANDKPSAIITH